METGNYFPLLFLKKSLIFREKEQMYSFLCLSAQLYWRLNKAGMHNLSNARRLWAYRAVIGQLGLVVYVSALHS